MEPLKIYQAIEESTLELFAWLCLFPITLVDLLFHPKIFLESMTIESSKDDSSRFDTRMPPVLFLLFGTVPLSIAIIKSDKDGATMPPVSDAVLLIALVLAVFPFVWALSALAASGRGFGRTAFRAAFSTQCYLFCPPWLFILIGTLAELHNMKPLSMATLLLGLGLIVWGLIAEWRLLESTASLGKRILCFTVALGLSLGAYQMIVAIAIATGQQWLA